MDGRRSLSFARLVEVLPEVDHLIAGHQTVGRWSLAQICNHLSAAIIASVEGSTFRSPWLLRRTFGALMVRQILKKGRFPDRIKLPETYWPKPNLDARAEAEALRATIQYFHSHTGLLADHPLGGPLNQASWERWHCLHAAIISGLQFRVFRTLPHCDHE